MPNILNIKTKKEILKELAKKSMLFAASTSTLNDFLRAVDTIVEDYKAEEYLDDMIRKFNEEREEVAKTYKNLLEE